MLVVASSAPLCADLVPLVTDPYNPRPVEIFPTAAGELSLQSILNAMWSSNPPNQLTRQVSPGLFGNTTGPGGASTSLLRAEWSGSAPGQSFGIFTPGAEPVPIFTGLGVPGDAAMLQWDPTGTLLAITRGGFTAASHVNEGIYSIDVFSFGFFLDTGAVRLYTVDELNAPALNPAGQMTSARGLAIQGRETEFAFAFESGSDFDYNDLVAKVESIAPIPEPASVLLFGTLLAGAVGIFRRRGRGA